MFSHHFIVQHLTPEINPDANDRRIQNANVTLSSLCAGLTSKISPLFSSCKGGYLRCTYAVGQYSSVDGYVKEITPNLPTVRIFQDREFQEEELLESQVVACRNATGQKQKRFVWEYKWPTIAVVSSILNYCLLKMFISWFWTRQYGTFEHQKRYLDLNSLGQGSH